MYASFAELLSELPRWICVRRTYFSWCTCVDEPPDPVDRCWPQCNWSGRDAIPESGAEERERERRVRVYAPVMVPGATTMVVVISTARGKGRRNEDREREGGRKIGSARPAR